MWSQQPAGKNKLSSGHPSSRSSSAAALLSYDIGHHLPWDWRVGLYTWTKGIAAGTYVAGVVLALLGFLAWEGSLFRVGVPLLSGLFLVLTGLVLIWDLEHPERFFYVLIRPQWQSWLARGAAVISLYGAVLAVHFLVGLGGQGRAAAWLAVAGLPLAVLTAVYTAYLLAQARGRDLWQSPLLPPHMAVQALVIGAAALAPLTAWLEPRALPPILILLAGACAAHLLLVAAEATLAHPTAHAETCSPLPLPGPARALALGRRRAGADRRLRSLVGAGRGPAGAAGPARLRVRLRSGWSVATGMTGLSAYPPREHWDDWGELESKAWPARQERRYTLVPTTCFNCEAACGLLAYVDRETLEVRKFEATRSIRARAAATVRRDRPL